VATTITVAASIRDPSLVDRGTGPRRGIALPVVEGCPDRELSGRSGSSWARGPRHRMIGRVCRLLAIPARRSSAVESRRMRRDGGNGPRGPPADVRAHPPVGALCRKCRVRLRLPAATGLHGGPRVLPGRVRCRSRAVLCRGAVHHVGEPLDRAHPEHAPAADRPRGSGRLHGRVGVARRWIG
jgi:hypothetical protein